MKYYAIFIGEVRCGIIAFQSTECEELLKEKLWELYPILSIRPIVHDDKDAHCCEMKAEVAYMQHQFSYDASNQMTDIYRAHPYD